MNVQYDRKKLAALFVTILFCSVSVWYAGKDGESITDELSEQDEPPDILGRREIRGADIQVAEEDIRNPFTATHETVAEDSQAQAVLQENKLPPETAAEKKTVPLAKQLEKPMPQAAARELHSGEPELCGIMQGSNGKMALLRFGGQTAVLSVGETFRDWLLVDIGEGAVILRKEWRERCLYLQSYCALRNEE